MLTTSTALALFSGCITCHAKEMSGRRRSKGPLGSVLRASSHHQKVASSVLFRQDNGPRPQQVSDGEPNCQYPVSNVSRGALQSRRLPRHRRAHRADRLSEAGIYSGSAKELLTPLTGKRARSDTGGAVAPNWARLRKSIRRQAYQPPSKPKFKATSGPATPCAMSIQMLRSGTGHLSRWKRGAHPELTVPLSSRQESAYPELTGPLQTAG
ncbi:hypothetical protein NDU88_003565 [Pleurodeles waltl]|uniref:Secreted protein n=1 Tax=Pleurodeles waltl TaxID=8319 RepID=A0AAV7TQ31_PLEWA|nr:hypothetical protein NDU88_003565 [Pleurodeles waltl]